jgi:hypothetical protein
MANFPSNIWIRDPIIEGRKIKGGGLNRGMELLVQARDEITAIETALGTDPAGSVTNLMTRLAVRHARSGLPRGKIQISNEPNSGWFNVSGFNVQIGITGALQQHDNTITFATAYSVAPSFVVARYVGHASDKLCGQCCVKKGSITTTDFHVLTKNFNTSDAWGNPTSSSRFYVIYAAFGGS